ncbi:hypothetical protein EJB05_42845, partial [Eragrostis curvula]
SITVRESRLLILLFGWREHQRRSHAPPPLAATGGGAGGGGLDGERGDLPAPKVGDCVQRWFQDNFKQACAGDPALMVCAGWICGERRAVDYHVRLVTFGSIEESSGMTKQGLTKFSGLIEGAAKPTNSYVSS